MNDVKTTTRARRAAVAAVVLAATLVGLGGGGAAPAGAASADDVRLNEIQVVGSHNSYHIAASPEETAIRRGVIGDADDLMQYTHAPLDEQLAEQKVRQFELDIFRDDAGGKFAAPLLRDAAGHDALDPAMNQPGTKVLHVQDVDYRSNCLSLVSCLTTIEAWSDANPNHLPVAILLELKDEVLSLGDLPFVVPDPWNAAAMDALDQEIRSVVDDDDLITPDDVRGDAATLEEAVLDTGWPTLAESRGKLMFLMDNGGSYRTRYLQGHPSLEGRVMFTNASRGQADAAFVKMNDSRGSVAAIQALVADGYVVRTRSDAETVEARQGDTSARDAAFASGAQWVSTDYPIPEYAEPFGTGYVVEIPGGTVARCNPINGPEGCVSADLEPTEPPEPPGEATYVDRIFQVFLGRGATEAEEAYWGGLLDDGLSRATVATRLYRTPEGRRGPAVATVFTSYLERPIDAPARTYWADVLTTRPLDHVEIAVLASPESYAKAGGSSAGYVDRLYRRLLGRGPDAAGQAYFVTLLDSGSSRSTVARLIHGSSEARRHRVAIVVTALLDRAPTPTERDALAERLRTSRDVRVVAADVVATDEFHTTAG